MSGPSPEPPRRPSSPAEASPHLTTRVAAVLVALVAACGGTDHPSCTVACSAEGFCPEGLVCTANNLCASPGLLCTTDGSSAFPDSPPQPDSPDLPDAFVADASLIDAAPCVGGDVTNVEDPMTGHCYMIFGGGRNWPQSRDNCLAHGAHLASLSSAAETTLVRSGSSTFRWIGLNDLASEGTFVWVNGDPLAFTNWNGGEPNDDHGGEDCVGILGNGKWNDFECGGGGGEFQSICERP